MLVSEVKENLQLALDFLDGKVKLTQYLKEEYGFEDSWRGKAVYAYTFRKKISYSNVARDYMSKTMLNEMISFCNLALELGFIGEIYFDKYHDYMKAYTRTTDDGVVPNEGALLYHDFSSTRNRYFVYGDCRNEYDYMANDLRSIKQMIREKGY